MFVENGQIFRTIDEMVDRIFNRFVQREGHLEPFFTEYCDGRRVHCPGLWQWSTVTLAEQGLNALQILRRFYPNDIQIVETDNIGGVQESFPGFTLRPGMSGPEVRTLQMWLNRIRVNFPAIPAVTVTGVYGPQTEAAVRAFQAIRQLGTVTPNGVVDRATWWNISRAYSAVKRLGELTSEGIVVGVGRTPPTEIIRQGSRGTLVQRAQYMMNFISQFYTDVPTVVQDSNFGPNFAAAVREFQRLFGLNPDGVIGPLTWRMLYDVYWRIRDNAHPPGESGVVPPLPPVPPPPGPGPGGIPPYPGQLIRVGSRGDDVIRVQRCLNSVNNAGLNTDGIFGPLTQNAVMNFQRSRGLNPDGIVGPITWGALMPACYGQTMSEYPGFLIREGERGDYVRQIQTCLNRVNNAGLNTDGVFGPLTRAAVVNYQRANGLNPDGIVGPITWNHLRNRCGGGRVATVQPRISVPMQSREEFVEFNNFPLLGDEIQEYTTSGNCDGQCDKNHINMAVEGKENEANYFDLAPNTTIQPANNNEEMALEKDNFVYEPPAENCDAIDHMQNKPAMPLVEQSESGNLKAECVCKRVDIDGLMICIAVCCLFRR